MKKGLKKILKSKKGGIATIITIVATTILSMGLFSYTIMSQSTAVKETGDKALLDQSRINLLLENPDYVTGKVVLSYYDRLDEADITVYDVDGSSVIAKKDIDNQGVYELETILDDDGKLSGAIFRKKKVGN